MAEGLHGYFEWQMQTLMLAHDVADPIPRGDDDAVDRRRDAVEREIGELVRPLIPAANQRNPNTDLPPGVIMEITRATLRHAWEVASRQSHDA